MNDLFVPQDTSKDSIENLLIPKKFDTVTDYLIFSYQNYIYSMERCGGNFYKPKLLAKRAEDVYIRALCEFKGDLYEGNDSGSVVNTLSGEIVASRFGHVTALAVHNGVLYDADMDGNIFKTFTNELVFENNEGCNDLCSYDGMLLACDNNGRIHDLSNGGDYAMLGGTTLSLGIVGNSLYVGFEDGDVLDIDTEKTMVRRSEAVNALLGYNLGFESDVLLDAGRYDQILVTSNDEIILDGKNIKVESEVFHDPAINAMCQYRGFL